jgi:hypothetical protein
MSAIADAPPAACWLPRRFGWGSRSLPVPVALIVLIGGQSPSHAPNTAR